MSPTVTHADAMVFTVSWWMAVKQQRQRIMPTTTTLALRGSRKVDAYLFVWSAHNLRSAAELVHRAVPDEVKPKIREAIDAFDDAAPDVRKVRNALSHFDEYVYGEGRLQRPGTAVHFGVYEAPTENDFELIISLVPGQPRLQLSVVATATAADELFRALGRAVDPLPMPALPGLPPAP